MPDQGRVCFFAADAGRIYFFAMEVGRVFFLLRSPGAFFVAEARAHSLTCSSAESAEAARVFFLWMPGVFCFNAAEAERVFFCCRGSGSLTHSPLLRRRRHNKKAATAKNTGSYLRDPP